MSIPIYICIGFFILIIAMFFRKPVLWCMKLIFNSGLGLAIIFAANNILPGMSAGINPFTAAVSGILGVPGAALVCILSKIL